MTRAESQRREFLHALGVQRALIAALGVSRVPDAIDREIADCHARDRAVERVLMAHRHARDVDTDNLRWEVGYLRRLMAGEPQGRQKDSA